MEWIEIKKEAGSMPDIDCWVSDGENVFYSPKGEYIPIGYYTHYMEVEKPKPPRYLSLPELIDYFNGLDPNTPKLKP